MPDPRRSIEIELEWLVSTYSPKILDEIKKLISTAVKSCGAGTIEDGRRTSEDGTNQDMKSSYSSYFDVILKGSEKSVYCNTTVSGDRVTKSSLHISVSDWNRGQELVIDLEPFSTILIDQIFNCGNILQLALEQLSHAQAPAFGTDDCFAKATFVTNLNETRRLLARSIQQLSDVDPQSIFPYTIFDSTVYKNSPDDLIMEYFIQSGKLCANIYIISQTNHQSPSHSRQKSTISQSAVNSASPNLVSSSYYFYNGSPIEIVFGTKIDATLPSTVTALFCIEKALGLLDDFCQKIDCIQTLLDSY